MNFASVKDDVLLIKVDGEEFRVEDIAGLRRLIASREIAPFMLSSSVTWPQGSTSNRAVWYACWALLGAVPMWTKRIERIKSPSARPRRSMQCVREANGLRPCWDLRSDEE